MQDRGKADPDLLSHVNKRLPLQKLTASWNWRTTHPAVLSSFWPWNSYCRNMWNRISFSVSRKGNQSLNLYEYSHSWGQCIRLKRLCFSIISSRWRIPVYLSSCLPVYQNWGLCVDGHFIPPDLAVEPRNAALQPSFCKMHMCVCASTHVCAVALHQVPEPLCNSTSGHLPVHLYILLPVFKYRYFCKQVYLFCSSKRKDRKGGKTL